MAYSAWNRLPACRELAEVGFIVWSDEADKSHNIVQPGPMPLVMHNIALSEGDGKRHGDRKRRRERIGIIAHLKVSVFIERRAWFGECVVVASYVMHTWSSCLLAE